MATDYRPTIKRVIEDNGEIVVFTAKDAGAYSEDTGWSQADGATQSVSIVPYNYFSVRTDYRKEGNTSKADLLLIYDGYITITADSTFTYYSKNYRVTVINPLPYAGYLLGNVIEADEVL